MIQWIKKLFWKRCFYCKQKKELFFYLWEVPWKFKHDKEYEEEELEICTDCAIKPVEDEPI
jgi:hypothetical protein